MSEWRDIESAPKDGTAILAYAPEGEFDGSWNDFEGRWLPVVAVVRWCINHPRHAAPDLQDNYAMWTGYYDGIGPFEGQVTHWMPLPAPPTVKAE